MGDPEWGELNRYRVTLIHLIDAETPDEAVQLALIPEASEAEILCELLDDDE